MLDDKALEMIDCVLESYIANKSTNAKFNPFVNDLFFVARLLSARSEPLHQKFETLVSELDKYARSKQPKSFEARQALTNLGMNENYRQGIVSLIIDRNDEYGNFVIDELVKLGVDAANDLLLSKIKTGRLEEGFDILSLRHSKSARVKEELIHRMMVAKEPYFFVSTLTLMGAKEAAPEMLACLDRTRPWHSHTIAKQIAHCGPQAESLLIEYLKNPKNKRRGAAVAALADTKNREALPLILNYILDVKMPMRNPRYNVARRLNIARHIDYVSDPKDIARLIYVLRDKQSYARHIAAIVLGNGHCIKAIPYLLDYVKDGPFPHFAIEALGNIGDENTIETLYNFGSDVKKPYYWMGILALGDIKSRKSVDYLVRIMRDKSNDCRYMAAKALGELGFTDCLGYLVEYIEKPNLQRDEIAREVAKLGKEKVIPLLYKYLLSTRGGELVIEDIGEIGGKQAVIYLNKLKQQSTDNRFRLSRIETAIAEAMTKSRPKYYKS